MFREPVDIKQVPDYYMKIKQPMDLSTIMDKIKSASYSTPREVYDDLKLIISNCKSYNSNAEIIKKANEFNKCIETVWTNLLKDFQKKYFSIDSHIPINEDILKRIEMIDDKKKKKKINTLQLDLIET